MVTLLKDYNDQSKTVSLPERYVERHYELSKTLRMQNSFRIRIDYCRRAHRNILTTASPFWALKDFGTSQKVLLRNTSEGMSFSWSEDCRVTWKEVRVCLLLKNKSYMLGLGSWIMGSEAWCRTKKTRDFLYRIIMLIFLLRNFHTKYMKWLRQEILCTFSCKFVY